MKKRIRRHYRTAKFIVYKETLVDLNEHLWTFLGSFCGIGIIGFIQSYFLSSSDNLFLIGSFGASAVLIYGVINSPLAQPRNLIGGHLLCAIIGVTVHKILPDTVWLSSALSVSVGIVAMQITKTLHPPGGATALIANIGSEKIISLGYWYVLCPILMGVVVLFIVALVFNNLTAHRNYPKNKHWYKIWNRHKKLHAN